jgi:hypothetical protein
VTSEGLDGELILRPAMLARGGMAVIFPTAVMTVAVPLYSDTTVPHRRVLAGALLIIAVVLLVRCWRQSIRCADGVATVRGVLTTRKVPGPAVVELATNEDTSDRYPVIRWRTPSGRHRQTFLTGFYAGTMALPHVRDHNLSELYLLDDWVDANRAHR